MHPKGDAARPALLSGGSPRSPRRCPPVELLPCFGMFPRSLYGRTRRSLAAGVPTGGNYEIKAFLQRENSTERRQSHVDLTAIPCARLTTMDNLRQSLWLRRATTARDYVERACSEAGCLGWRAVCPRSPFAFCSPTRSEALNDREPAEAPALPPSRQRRVPLAGRVTRHLSFVIRHSPGAPLAGTGAFGRSGEGRRTSSQVWSLCESKCTRTGVVSCVRL